MITGVGVDLCSILRFEAMVKRRPSVLTRILTENEASRSVESQAACFAAKEALIKAIGSPSGLKWHEAEIAKTAEGKPIFRLLGFTAQKITDLGIKNIHLSISHDNGFAIAMVVCEG